jgi:hypothetical protein
VRCSLLALSSYIDSELDLEPAGELEAHLVACERCRTAVGHLREESTRIGALARVHVPDEAVHELFSQIGLIAEEDDLPEGPVHHDRPAPVEAPPWFGAERGAALPWAPRPSGQDQTQPRELIGERSPGTAVADPPELLLWDETIDQIATAVPAPPPVRVVPMPEPVPAPVEPQVYGHVDAEPAPVEPQVYGHVEAEPAVIAAHVAGNFDPDAALVGPQPPQLGVEPQPPDLSTSASMIAPPRLAAGPNAFHRLRDAIAVRFALRRGGEATFDSGVEIVSGIGAPKWNQRAHTRSWSDSPPVVAATAPPGVVAPSPVTQTATKPGRLRHFLGLDEQVPAAASETAADVPPAHSSPPDTPNRSTPIDTQRPVEATAPLELADVLSEVASLAAPLERTAAPAVDDDAPARMQSPTSAPAETETLDDAPPPRVESAEVPPIREVEYRGAVVSPMIDAEVDSPRTDPGDAPFEYDDEPGAAPVLGRHVRRLHSQKADRRDWNPTHPVTGRHVLPLGGPAVGAADRDRRLWLFGAATVVLMLLGLLVGRQVTQTAPLVASTIPKSTPTHHATIPPTAAPLPIATLPPAPAAVIPTPPTAAQLTSVKTLGTGSSGFSVADVRYGEHPNDFRLVFDMAYPDSVSGDPDTLIGFDGPTTLYVEFTGVNGAADIATMPKGQVVVSVVALPMARNTGRLVFKITLSKKATFDAYYLSGARLVIDVT